MHRPSREQSPTRLLRGCERGEFRVVHYSIRHDHSHFLVEAGGRQVFSRGMKSLAARFARAANRSFGRSGGVLDGRYHARVLRTPREVRNALAYVLLNARRHWKKRRGVGPPVRLDEASSGQWFGGWTNFRAAGSSRRAGGAGGSWIRPRCREADAPPLALSSAPLARPCTRGSRQTNSCVGRAKVLLYAGLRSSDATVGRWEFRVRVGTGSRA